MKRFTNSRKFLFGLSVSMVLAMAIGSFALSESQTQASPQAVGATAGAFTVTGGTQGTDYDFTGTSGTDGVLKIHPQSIGTNITISNTGTTTDRIEVTSAATITLSGVNIDRSSITTNEPAALTITDNANFDVKILLADNTTNILKGANGDPAGTPGSPGIQKNGEGASIGTLTIGAPNGSQGTGTLEATGGRYAAGIGGGYHGSGSNITISGGVVTANGGMSGAGIGGGISGSGNDITITGGEVTANGGTLGAGIGGGYKGNGSDITITGGVVTATGGQDGAGIGGGQSGSGSNITISGGVVTATGGNNGSGIGGGSSGIGSGITINGGEVTATGGSGGAGIGGGYYGTGSNITINGGKVTANGGDSRGAGIGGGDSGSGSNITITGGEVTANGGDTASGIGGGFWAAGSNITISGGEVTANGGRNYAAGIGGGSSGIGSGITINGGVVIATGGFHGAGIGGGSYERGSDITISGGEVTATGGSGGAGIGGGYQGIGSNITITGGVVKAYGGQSAAGIGGGDSGSGSGNSLNGDVVALATSGDAATKPALEGFVDGQGGSLLTKGIAFTGLGTAFDSQGRATDITWDSNGTMYGNVTLSQDLKIPANLTVPANQILSIKEDKDVTLSEETGAKYTIQGELRNNGTVTLPTDLALSGNGKVTTKTDFYLEGSTGVYATGYQTYQTSAGVQNYSNLPNPYQDPANGKRLINWYYLDQSSQQVPISESINVLLNEHSFYENSVEQFTVTFSVPTGTAPAAQTIDDGSKATAPQISWTDGTVEGWYKENTYQNKWNFDVDTVTGNITLYARFQYTVTFNVPTGTAPQAQNVDIGGKATDPQFSWTDGTVEGWYTENTYQNKWNFDVDTVTGNITLYAKFQCTVTFDPNYSGGSEATSQTVAYDNTVQEPDEPTRDGYSFVEWCKDEECTTAWDFGNDKVQGDMTLYAKWLGNEHSVIIPTNPDDHGTVTTDPENPKTGEEVIITVTPEEGYKVDGLPIVKTEDGRIIEVVPTGNPNEYKFIMPDSDVTIEVNFVLISEPTVDPDVKTGDSFAGIAALAILGVATTGTVLLRKRK